MAFCYKKFWKLLIDRDMTRADLRTATGLSPTTLAKMSKGEAIGVNVLTRICEALNYNVGCRSRGSPAVRETGWESGLGVP